MMGTARGTHEKHEKRKPRRNVPLPFMSKQLMMIHFSPLLLLSYTHNFYFCKVRTNIVSNSKSSSHHLHHARFPYPRHCHDCRVFRRVGSVQLQWYAHAYQGHVPRSDPPDSVRLEPLAGCFESRFLLPRRSQQPRRFYRSSHQGLLQDLFHSSHCHPRKWHCQRFPQDVSSGPCLLTRDHHDPRQSVSAHSPK
jgi:hypothetical protein